MTSERSIDRQTSCFFISNLADHDDIRILAHQRAQARTESETNLRLHLRLIHARHLILNRIFDSRDIHIWLVQNFENSVECRGFTRTSWAGDQNHAGGLLCRPLDAFETIAVETALLQRETARGIGQETHHYFFPEIGW